MPPFVAAALAWVAFALAAPVLLFHPRVRRGLKVRLGFYPVDPVPGPGPRVWLQRRRCR